MSGSQPEILRKNLKAVSDTLYNRVQTGELSNDEYKRYLAKYADQLLSKVHWDRVPDVQAWQYGEVFRTAQKWPEAEDMYTRAVKGASNEDRLVNDSLHLAEAKVHLGKVPEGLALVRSTFKARPEDKAPILTGTLFEILPAAQGKGDDADLAATLEGAASQADQVIVDPKSDSGKAFLSARPFQIKKALLASADLYRRSGDEAKATDASAKAEAIKTTPI